MAWKVSGRVSGWVFDEEDDVMPGTQSSLRRLRKLVCLPGIHVFPLWNKRGWHPNSGLPEFGILEGHKSRIRDLWGQARP
jgi:hypothetical protein